MQQPKEEPQNNEQKHEEGTSQNNSEQKVDNKGQLNDKQVQANQSKQQQISAEQKQIQQKQNQQKPAQKQLTVEKETLKVENIQEKASQLQITVKKQQSPQKVKSPQKQKEQQGLQKVKSAQKQKQQPISQNVKSAQKQKQQPISQSVKSAQKQKQQPKSQQKEQKPIRVSLQAKNLDIGQSQSQIKNEQDKQKQQIRLSIIQQVQIGSSLLGFLVYRISGFDSHGKVDINRKYTEFQALRRILQQRWPGCFIPSLNDKSEIKNAQQKKLFKFRWMQHFLMGLARSPFIYYKQQVQLFLRSPGMDYKEMFDQMPSLKAADIIQRFKSCFGEEVQKPSVLSNSVQISNLSTSLKKVLHNLGELSIQTLKLADSFDNYKLSLQKATEFFYYYQQFALSQYIENDREKTLVIKDENSRLKNLSQMQGKNIFYQLYQNLEFQAKDAEAFLDIILSMEMFTLKRDQLQSSAKEVQLQIDQIALGHKSVKVMTSRKTKQQIQTELEARQKQLMSQKLIVVELFNISEIVLASKSATIFKKYKQDSYKGLIKKWIETGNQVNPEIATLWKFINQETKQLHSKSTKQQ